MRHRWAGRALASLLLVSILGGGPTAALASGDTAAEQAKIFLVALNDNGRSGPAIGCGDSLVPVTVEITPVANTTPARITAALQRLFAIRDQFYGQSGLYNSLYRSSLTVSRVEIQGDVAAVYLNGTPNVGGVCDEPRAEGQIAATAAQFAGLREAIIIREGGPLFSPPGQLDFPQTGHFIAAPFHPYWQDQGGLPLFGYPISDQRVENGLRVQYFERQRFEYHPENNRPYKILFGLLGRQDAERRNLFGTVPFQRKSASGNVNCEYFAITGHNVCFAFRTYWHGHGLDFGEPGFSARESLALFGFPLSDEFRLQLEDGNTYTVQYFERARFEYHPNNPEPYKVLLGRLAVP